MSKTAGTYLSNINRVSVFSYLSLADRKRTRLVSKHWLELSKSASLTKDDIITVRMQSDLDQFNIRRRNMNLRIEGIEHPLKHPQFWKDQGPSVKSIEMFLVDLQSPVLGDILDYCPKIEFLSLSNRDVNESRWLRKDEPTNTEAMENSCSKLENLLSLDLLFMFSMTGAQFSRLTNNVPKLKRLGLGFQGNKQCEDSVVDAVMALIQKQATTLKELNFTKCRFLTEIFLKRFTEHLGPQLTGLYIPECPCKADDCLPLITKKLPNLEELDLSFNAHLTNHLLPSLFLTFKNLKLISFRKTKIDDNVLSAVADLDQLRGLDVTHCKCLTADGISRAFGQKQHPKLFDLRLNNIPCVTDDVLAHILPKLPNLKYLYLDNCRKIGVNGVPVIINNCKILRCLSLQNCKKIRHLIEPVNVSNIKGLIHLDLFGCSGLDDDTVSQLKFVELQTVDLSDVNLSEKGLITLVSNCPSLQRLHLSDALRDQVDVKKIPRKDGSKYPILAFGYCPFDAESIFD